MLKENEATILKKVRIVLQQYEIQGLLVWYRPNTWVNPAVNRFKTIGRRGFSDFIIFLKNNQTLFIEVKTQNGKLNPYQIEFKDKIEKLGYKYHIVKSTDDLRIILRKLRIIV